MINYFIKRQKLIKDYEDKIKVIQYYYSELKKEDEKQIQKFADIISELHRTWRPPTSPCTLCKLPIMPKGNE